jgi:hypothetical protein
MVTKEYVKSERGAAQQQQHCTEKEREEKSKKQ